MHELKGRRALVTGANRGLGRRISLRLARAGAQVILGVRDPRRAEPVRDEIATTHGTGGGAEIQALDLADFASIARAGEEIRSRHRALHVLINNAGVRFHDGDRDLDGLTPEILSRTMTVNAMGPLMLIREMLPLLRASGSAHVVNVGSDMADLKDMEGRSHAYRLSKLVLHGMTLNLAAELAADGVRVSGFDPGWMKTAMGGPDATEDPEISADGLLATVCLPPDRPSGKIWWREALPSPILDYP
ncbi:MAG: SDR family NAD(P)-dependent oxidoreductase [Acidobacteriota bacterium]|jgi:NAD(P)-dependent dehydrogenase (short-subunit alcohol dehydrogenase family)